MWKILSLFTIPNVSGFFFTVVIKLLKSKSLILIKFFPKIMENYIFLNTWQNYTNAYLNYIFFESIPLTNSKTMLIIMYAKSLKIKFLS